MKRNKLYDIPGWVIVLALMVSSCHTERATQKVVSKAIANQDAFAQLGNYWQILHPCINDTVTNTLIKTIPGQPVVKHDTTIVNGVVYIRDSVFVHDTTYKEKTHTVIDGRALNQLKDTLNTYKRLFSNANAKATQQWADSIRNEQLYQANLKAEKKKTSKANWRFIWACLVGGVLLFRKPLLSLATGGWSKLLRVFK